MIEDHQKISNNLYTLYLLSFLIKDNMKRKRLENRYIFVLMNLVKDIFDSFCFH
jgi:hypothetical protein